MTTETSNKNNSPSHFAYQVQKNEGQKLAYWRRVGSAWQHKDQKGFSISLDAMPIDGRITLRLANEAN